jgi:hypothetical protein
MAVGRPLVQIRGGTAETVRKRVLLDDDHALLYRLRGLGHRPVCYVGSVFPRHGKFLGQTPPWNSSGSLPTGATANTGLNQWASIYITGKATGQPLMKRQGRARTGTAGMTGSNGKDKTNSANGNIGSRTCTRTSSLTGLTTKRADVTGSDAATCRKWRTSWPRRSR